MSLHDWWVACLTLLNLWNWISRMRYKDISVNEWRNRNVYTFGSHHIFLIERFVLLLSDCNRIQTQNFEISSHYSWKHFNIHRSVKMYWEKEMFIHVEGHCALLLSFEKSLPCSLKHRNIYRSVKIILWRFCVIQ